MRLQFFAKVAKFRPNLVSLQVLSFNLCVCSPLFSPSLLHLLVQLYAAENSHMLLPTTYNPTGWLGGSLMNFHLMTTSSFSTNLSLIDQRLALVLL